MFKKYSLIILLSFFVFNGHSMSSEKVIWYCKTMHLKKYMTEDEFRLSQIFGDKVPRFNPDVPTLRFADLLLVKLGNNSYVEFSGNKITTDFSFEGFDKRWDWGKYSIFLINDQYGDLKALYYDFSTQKKAKPSKIFECNKFDNTSTDILKCRDGLGEYYDCGN